MDAKRFFFVCAGMLCLALAYHLGSTNATAQSRTVESKTGRFTIAAGSNEVILLDTVTGEASRLDTWIVPEKDFPSLGGGKVFHWSRVSQDYQHAYDAVRRGDSLTK
ncbi:MAG TPA: hypothetical protein VFQ05_05365 [Candidatus Eisenbacteria bacterium]|nr:hypothetical protein [Candidatus Eisenbacteria bacterium]